MYYYIIIVNYYVGVAMRAGPAHLGATRIRPAQRGLVRPALHIFWPAGLRAGPFFFYIIFFIYFFNYFMIKLLMFKSWETLRSSQN